jgi:putative acetyltransferase
VIQLFDESHIDDLLEVWYRASKQAHPFLPDDFFERERRAIVNQYLPLARTWIYAEKDRVIGFIAMIGNEVGGLFVDPECQGRGIGRALLDHVTRLYDELEVDVFKENRIGRRFYDRYGFEVVTERAHDQTGHVLLRMKYRCEE